MRFMFLRHAQSTDNAGRVASSALPGANLTELGLEQAAAAASALKDQAVAAVYASPASRALATARAISPDAVAVPGLEEYGLGECEGRTDQASWAACNAVFRRWLHGEMEARVPGGGESGHEVVERFTKVVRDIESRHANETVVVVSHAGTLTAGLLALCGDLTVEMVWGRPLPHAVPFAVSAGGPVWSCPDWPGIFSA